MPQLGNLIVFSEVNEKVVAHHLRLSDDETQWSILVEFKGFGSYKDITCGPIPIGDHLFGLVKNDHLLQIYTSNVPSPITDGPTKLARVSDVATIESTAGIFNIASCWPQPHLAVSNEYPALAVYTVPELKQKAWCPLDQVCPWIFSVQNGTVALLVGKMPEIIGIHYSMMSIPK